MNFHGVFVMLRSHISLRKICLYIKDFEIFSGLKYLLFCFFLLDWGFAID